MRLTPTWENPPVSSRDPSRDIDKRSERFVGLTRENLAQLAADWPVSADVPPAVAELLAESRRLFVGAAVTYDKPRCLRPEGAPRRRPRPEAAPRVRRRDETDNGAADHS